MEKILTAKELFDKMISENDEVTSTEMMIEFAKLHVEVALKDASERLDSEYCFAYSSERNFYDEQSDSILNAYPLTNIK